jgi:hypothetical protein
MLSYAMGSLPEKDPDDGTATGFADHLTGLILPRKRKKKERTQSIELARLRSMGLALWQERIAPVLKKMGIGARQGERIRLQAGKKFNLHNATILGYVIPSPPDQTVPLIANNREDFDVVASLLTEHYAQFEGGGDEQELDDTDPSDKDFLFGAMLREHGVLENRDQLVSTLYWGLALGQKALPKFLVRGVELCRRVYEERFSRYPNLLPDSYAALNHGRGHLVQGLFYLMTDRKKPLTSRADSSALYAAAKGIFESLATIELKAADMKSQQATLRNRLEWIGSMFFGIAERPVGRMRGVLRALAICVVLAVAGFSIQHSVKYHDVFLERMVQEKLQIAEKQRQQKQEQGKNGHK